MGLVALCESVCSADDLSNLVLQALPEREGRTKQELPNGAMLPRAQRTSEIHARVVDDSMREISLEICLTERRYSDSFGEFA